MWAGRKPALSGPAEQAALLGRFIFRAHGDRTELNRLKDDLVAGLNRLDDRLRLNRLAPPLTAALIGPTGVGKSKVFNSLIGRDLSPSGYKRPTTPQPVLAALPQDLEKFAGPDFLPNFHKIKVSGPVTPPKTDERPTLYLVEADRRLTPGLALIDTPDFDSLHSANRAIANEIFQRCDAVIIVADESKYADLALWEFLLRLKGGPQESFILLNRVGPQAGPVISDFQKRLLEAGLNLPLAVWPEEPHLKDQDLLNLNFEDGRLLRNWVTLAAAGRQTLQETIAKAEQARLKAELEHLLAAVDLRLAEYDRLRGLISELQAQTTASLGEQLTINLSDEVKAALLAKFKELFNRFDVLARPRRYLLAPLVALKNGLGKFTLSGSKAGPPEINMADAPEIGQLLAEGGEALVVAAAELGRRQSRAVTASELGSRLSEQDDFKNLPLPPGEVRAAYQEVRHELESWLTEEAQELVKNLGLGEKATFYTAQLVTMGLIVSLQIHTGGGFSLIDGLTDGLAAPILARLAGAAISRDKIKALETRAAARHLAGAESILARQTERFLSFLQTAGEGLEVAAELKSSTLN